MAKTQAEKKAEEAQKLADLNQATLEGEYSPSEESDEEMMARLRRESDEKEAALRSAEAPEEDDNTPRYSKKDVLDMVNEMKKHFQNNPGHDEDDEIDGERKHTVRMPRLQNKFIIGFRNLNTDPYFPDRVIHSVDIFDDKTRSNIPHVKVIFEDDTKDAPSELLIPAETLFKVAKTIDCELVEVKEVDVSVKYGLVEVKKVEGDSYAETGTGDVIKGKAVQKKYSYVVKLPADKNTKERVVTVGGEVINW